MARIAVVGNATRDVNRAGVFTVRRPGGTLLYASLALKALGHDVRPVGWAPLRAFGWLKRAGIDTTDLRVAIPGTQFLNVYEGEARRQWARRGPADALDGLVVSRVDGILLGPVLGEVRPDAAMPDGVPVLLDVQGSIRRLGPRNRFGWREVELAAETSSLPRATHVRGSREELSRLTGASDAAEAVRVLHDQVGATTIVTMGAEGALAYDGALHRARVAPVDAPDPTGAGDVFDAGVLHGVVQGRPLPESLALGCAAARVFLSRTWTRRALERFATAEDVEALARNAC